MYQQGGLHQRGAFLAHGIVWVTTLHLAEAIEPFDLVTDATGELFYLLTNTVAASDVGTGGRVEFAKASDAFLQLRKLFLRIATLYLVLLALLAANPNASFVQRSSSPNHALSVSLLVGKYNAPESGRSTR